MGLLLTRHRVLSVSNLEIKKMFPRAFLNRVTIRIQVQTLDGVFEPCCILQLAKKYHPDINQNDPEAQKKFQAVSEAYEVAICRDVSSQYNTVQ